jgi:signal recognition particle receptor subunit beta
VARVVVKNNTIQAKLVYYGPGLCGKTTNLQWVNKHLARDQELMSLATEGDRTIFFDFMPLDLGKLRNMDVQFKLYTVPGQVRYNQTRKMVLKNVDGVVFVADSQPQMMDANLESLDNLFSNLQELGINAEQLVIVLQYNKRDLPGVLPRDALDAALNQHKYPTFLASAHSGQGVVDTLKEACRLILQRLATQLPETGKHKIAADLLGSDPSPSGVMHVAADATRSVQPTASAVSTSAPRSASAPLRKAAVANGAQPLPASRAAAGSSVVAQAAAAEAIHSVPTTLRQGAPPAPAHVLPARAPAQESSPTPAVVSPPPPPSDVQHVSSRSQAELGTGLEHALGEAQRLVGELKRELDAVRAERARAASSDSLSGNVSQTLTKADFERARRELPSKAEVQAVRDGMQLLATKERVEQLQSGLPTRAAVEGLVKTVETLRTQSDASSQRVDRLLSPISDLVAMRSELKALEQRVLERVAGAAQAAPAAAIPTGRDGNAGALEGRLAVLATKVELSKMYEEFASRQTAALERKTQDLVEKLTQPKADASRAPREDVVTKGDLAALAAHVKSLPTIEHLAKLPTIEHLAKLQAAPRDAGQVSTADLKSLVERLNQLPTKADLEKLIASRSGETTAADARALRETLGLLARKTDVDALQAQVRTLAAALIELSTKSSRLEAEATAARAEERQREPAAAVRAAVVEPPPPAPAPTNGSAQPEAQPTVGAAPAEGETRAARAESAVPNADQAKAAEAEADEAKADDAKADDAKADDAEAHAGEAGEAKAEETKNDEARADETKAIEAESAAQADAAKGEAAESEEPASQSQGPEQAQATQAAPPTSAAEPAEKPAPTSEASPPAPKASPAEPAKPEVDPYAGNREHQNAARIARVMVADLYLYNKEQVDAGITNNDFYERNTEALADMRLTYESRVKEEIRTARDYLQIAIEEFIKKKKKQLGLEV